MFSIELYKRYMLNLSNARLKNEIKSIFYKTSIYLWTSVPAKVVWRAIGALTGNWSNSFSKKKHKKRGFWFNVILSKILILTEH